MGGDTKVSGMPKFLDCYNEWDGQAKHKAQTFRNIIFWDFFLLIISNNIMLQILKKMFPALIERLTATDGKPKNT